MTNKNLTAYIGTYTNGESKGIYKFTMDKSSGKVLNVDVAANLQNPTYLNIDKTNKYLYSVIKIGEEGGIAALSINDSTGELELLDYKTSKGAPPCYVSMNVECTYVFSANYHKGHVTVFKVSSDKNLITPCSIVNHEGSGPNKDRQEKPHVHYVSLTSDEKHLCSIDLGTDELVVYDFHDGMLSKSNKLSVHLKPGCGPRHMAFHPHLNFAYIITELSSEVITLKYSASDCSFKEIDYTSALPKDFNKESAGGAIHISPDGKYLYASNRGHDSIAVFSIDSSSGKLSSVSYTSTEGSHPRDFAIDPSGNFLIAANQNSNSIVPFSIDKITGKLTKISNPISIPNPVCIKFIHL